VEKRPNLSSKAEEENKRKLGNKNPVEETGKASALVVTGVQIVFPEPTPEFFKTEGGRVHKL